MTMYHVEIHTADAVHVAHEVRASSGRAAAEKILLDHLPGYTFCWREYPAVTVPPGKRPFGGVYEKERQFVRAYAWTE